MAGWVDIGEQAKFSPGEQVCLEVEDARIVVFNVDGELLSIANICPHAGLPLGDGELRGLVLTCPFHGNGYNVKTGANVDFPYEELPVRTYPVRLNGGRVEVYVEPPKPRPRCDTESPQGSTDP